MQIIKHCLSKLKSFNWVESMRRKKTIRIINPNPLQAGHRLRMLYLLESQALRSHCNVYANYLTHPIKLNFQKAGPLRKFLEIVYWGLKIEDRSLLLKFAYLFASSSTCVFSKPYHAYHLKAMKIARFFGKRIISDFCDFHESRSEFIQAALLSDIIVCPTETLAARVKSISGSKASFSVIEDMLDPVAKANPSPLLKAHEIQTEKPTVLWFGLAFAGDEPTHSFRHFSQLSINCLQEINRLGFTIEVVCEDPERSIQFLSEHANLSLQGKVKAIEWSPNSMRNALARPGIVVIQYPEPVSSCEKSSNRIELALYLGKEVYTNGWPPSLDAELKPFVNILTGSTLPSSALTLNDPNLVEKKSIVNAYLDQKQNRIQQKWDELIFQASDLRRSR